MNRHTFRRHRYLAALLIVAGLVVAACTSGGGATATAVTSLPAGGGLMVRTATSALGTFLTDPDGRTLYVFTKDSANTSNCTASCADNWPPLTVAAGQQAQAASGVTGTLATLSRPDGATQVSYNGMPLYYFKGDAKAGDTNGQGVGGVWFVAGAAGGPLGSGAPAPGASGAPSMSPTPPPGGYEY